MSDTFHIVLRDLHRHDSFETREFDLPLDSTYPIGRASKSLSKRALMPAPHNAFIDSPVISREHAVLSARLYNGTPQVYLTDSGSMHGTMLNGRKLLPNQPNILVSGDMLQFGVDVNRNEGTSRHYFVARKYRFEARLAPPYSLGFVVPDAESEEENIDPRDQHGSKLNPLILDDSDVGCDESGEAHEKEQKEEEDMTVVNTAEPEPSKLGSLDLDGGHEHVGIHNEAYPEPDTHTTPVIEEQSEEEESVQYSSDNEDCQGFDAASNEDTESAVNSEGHHSSEPEMPDSDDDDASSALASRPLHLESGAVSTYADFPYGGATIGESRNAFTLDQDEGVPKSSLHNNLFGRPPDTFESAASTMPPQPTVLCGEPSTMFTKIDQRVNRDWSDFVHFQGHYMGTNYGERPSLFSPAPPPPPPPFSEHMEFYSCPLNFGDGTDSAHQALSLQTPPPMPASEVIASTPQPVRRTKVTIEEIVEDQPPTPESVNNMKRKADVLEEREDQQQTVVIEDSPIVPQEPTLTASQVVDAQAEQTAALVAQRPKKQPRSVIAKVGLTAKYLGLGTAGAFAAFTALSTLPDAFFV